MKVRSDAMIIVVLCSGALFILSALYFTVPMLDKLSSFYAINSQEVALTITLFSITFAVGSLFFGPVSNQLGRKRVMLVGLMILSLATIAAYAVEHFIWLLILRAIQGVAAATFSPVALTYIGEVFSEERKVKVIAYMSTGFLMSGLLGQILSSIIVVSAHWSYVFVVFGLIYAALAVTFVIVLPEVPKVPMNTTQSIKLVLQNRSILLCYTITLTILLCFVGAYTSIEYYLTAPPISLSFLQMLVIRACGMMALILCPFVGGWGRKYGVTKVLQGGLMLAILGLLLLSWMKSVIGIVIASVIFVAGIAFIVPCIITLIGQYGEKSRGLATSLYTFTLFIGASIGPQLAVFMIDHFSYTMVYYCFVLIFLVSYSCTWLLTRTKVEHG